MVYSVALNAGSYKLEQEKIMNQNMNSLDYPVFTREHAKALEEQKSNRVEYLEFLKSCDFIKAFFLVELASVPRLCFSIPGDKTSIVPLLLTSFVQASSQWRKVQDLLETDERCSRLEKIDCLEIFQEYIRDLDGEEEKQRKLQMEELRKAERKNRDEFRKLMEEHVAAGIVNAKTNWRDYCINIKDFAAYLVVSSITSGSTAKDLFTDVMDELEKQAQDLVTSRAQEYARKTRFEHKQGHVWKIAWSIEDLKNHGFGQHLMGNDLFIFIKGAITMEPAAASGILAKLEAITRQWEVINERLDHMGVPREQVGYPDTCQDKDRSSCELRGRNVIPYTHMNVVTVLPSVGVNESSFFDTLDIVRSHEDQTFIVGTQALVDPLDDEIDSLRENDLCPSGASTYNLTKGEQNDQPGVDDIDLLEYLENPSCDCICEDDFDCGPLAFRDGLYVCEDNSCEREGDMCLEMPSTSSLCVSYVGHIPRGNFETSSKCMHGNALFEVDLWNSFLNPLLVHDIFNSDKDDLLNFEDDTLGESECGRDLSPWLHLPFDPGLDSSRILFKKGRMIQYLDDKSQIKDAVRMAEIGFTSAWTLNDFKVAIAKYISSPPMSDTNLKFVFEELLERAKEKEEKEAKKCKRLADEFYELLHASKEITASSKWEDCKSLFGDRQVASFAFVDLELVARLQGPLENDN
ncbi:Pre-mRNA-processing protein 40A [Capsicum chinense]|nr:Pre-mRNA-processing protein 40A [Capsicum chinense]